jgi:hypothetical protein
MPALVGATAPMVVAEEVAAVEKGKVAVAIGVVARQIQTHRTAGAQHVSQLWQTGQLGVQVSHQEEGGGPYDPRQRVVVATGGGR